MGVLIEDGQVRKGVYVDQFGNTDGFEFHFRPAMPDEWYEYRSTPKPNGKSAAEQVRKVILKHLASWSLNAEISDETLRRLPHQALEFVVDSIFLYHRSEEAQAAAKN